MAHPAISVIIASWQRPEWLQRCLRAVAQLDYPRFEIVVVACSEGAQAARDFGLSRVLTVTDANISAARNAGVSAAAGEVIAFIDDDAVPEPTWLLHLSSAFADETVVQAGGTTLGRNGISVQHAAARVLPDGQSCAVRVASPGLSLIAPENSAYPRLHGTNMAIRRATIVQHDGFDERFSFYLDETDLSLRISKAGGVTAFVPKAVVHHGSGASRFRDAQRTPKRVFEIAASASVFHQKHCTTADVPAAQAAFFAERRRWILTHMVNGTVAPDTAHRLIRELSDGYAQGTLLAPARKPQFAAQNTFDPAPVNHSGQDVYLVAQTRDRDATRDKARTLVADGHRVTVFDYRPTARPHRVFFTGDGYWLHTGGIYGPELRTEPRLQRSTRTARIVKTLERLSDVRSQSGLQNRH